MIETAIPRSPNKNTAHKTADPRATSVASSDTRDGIARTYAWCVVCGEPRGGAANGGSNVVVVRRRVGRRAGSNTATQQQQRDAEQQEQKQQHCFSLPCGPTTHDIPDVEWSSSTLHGSILS